MVGLVVWLVVMPLPTDWFQLWKREAQEVLAVSSHWVWLVASHEVLYPQTGM